MEIRIKMAKNGWMVILEGFGDITQLLTTHVFKTWDEVLAFIDQTIKQDG